VGLVAGAAQQAAQQQATACGGLFGIIMTNWGNHDGGLWRGMLAHAGACSRMLGHARVMAGHARAPTQQRGEGSWCWREAGVG
jgi:hypothetical protein